MSRSLKKGPFVDENVYRKVQKLDEQKKKEPIKTWARACTILPSWKASAQKLHSPKHPRFDVREYRISFTAGIPPSLS